MTEEYWLRRYSDEDVAFRNGTYRAGNVASAVGKWSFHRHILDIQSEAGVMIHLLRDAGFHNAFGVDNSPEVSVLWDHPDALITAEPNEIDLPDESQDIVTWFEMYDTDRLDCTVEDVVNEMKRLTRGLLVLRPFDVYTKKKYEESQLFFMKNRLKVERENYGLGYFYLSKE